MNKYYIYSEEKDIFSNGIILTVICVLFYLSDPVLSWLGKDGNNGYDNNFTAVQIGS